MRVPRLAWVGVWAVMLPLGIWAQTPQNGATAAEVRLQLADLLFADGRYQEAREAYRRATGAADPAAAGRGAAGVVLSQLRVGAFRQALNEAQSFAATHRADPLLTAVHGDALWSCGMFEEAEAAYDAALALDSTL